MARRLVAGCVLVLCLSACASPGQEAALRFYAPLDDHARGLLVPEGFALEATAEFQPVEGMAGGGCSLTEAGLVFGLERFLSNEEGSIAVWLKTNWDPAETATRMLIDLGRFACLRRWQSQQYLTSPSGSSASSSRPRRFRDLP